MKITYIHHSCFLVESDRFYYLFDYEQGDLPTLNPAKPMFSFPAMAILTTLIRILSRS